VDHRPDERLVRSERRDVVEILEFMTTNQTESPIGLMCGVFKVSRSGFHAWRDRRPSPRCVADEALSSREAAADERSGGTYGAPRGLSVRQGCQLMGVARSSFYAEPQGKPRDAEIVAEIRAITDVFEGYGYRRVGAEAPDTLLHDPSLKNCWA
jgi:hypothetical protein